VNLSELQQSQVAVANRLMKAGSSPPEAWAAVKAAEKKQLAWPVRPAVEVDPAVTALDAPSRSNPEPPGAAQERYQALRKRTLAAAQAAAQAAGSHRIQASEEDVQRHNESVRLDEAAKRLMKSRGQQTANLRAAGFAEQYRSALLEVSK
jgi:hypothetical protein